MAGNDQDETRVDALEDPARRAELMRLIRLLDRQLSGHARGTESLLRFSDSPPSAEQPTRVLTRCSEAG